MEVVDDYPEYSRIQKLYDLGRVCASWWSTLKSCARIWASVDVDYPRTVKAFLRRSGTLPLRLMWKTTVLPWGSVLRQEVDRAMAASIERIRSIEISTAVMTQGCNLTTSQFLSNLNDLNIEHPEGSETSFDWPDGHFSKVLPQLVTLQLSNTLPPPEAKKMKLQNLRMVGIRSDVENRLFLSFLRSAPALTSLTLKDVCIQGVPQDAHPASARVSLPALKTLELVDVVSPEALHLFLQVLLTPQLKELSISLDTDCGGYAGLDDDEAGATVLDSVFRPRHRLSPQSACLTNNPSSDVFITLTDGLIEVKGGGLSFCMASEAGWGTYAAAMTRQTTLFRDTPVVVTASHPMEDDARSIHPAFLFPSARILKLFWLYTESTVDFINTLASRQPYINNSAKWMCPNLAELHIYIQRFYANGLEDHSGGEDWSDEDGELAEALSKMLKARRKAKGKDRPSSELAVVNSEGYRFDEPSKEFKQEAPNDQ